MTGQGDLDRKGLCEGCLEDHRPEDHLAGCEHRCPTCSGNRENMRAGRIGAVACQEVHRADSGCPLCQPMPRHPGKTRHLVVGDHELVLHKLPNGGLMIEIDPATAYYRMVELDPTKADNVVGFLTKQWGK